MPPENILQISKAHGFLNKCILVYIIIIGALLLVGDKIPQLKFSLSLGLIAVTIVALVACIGLSRKLYPLPVTIFFALFALIPGIGGIPLLLVSNKANKVLREAGYKVGFLGTIKQ